MTVQSRTKTYLTEDEAEAHAKVQSELSTEILFPTGIFRRKMVMTAASLTVDLPEDDSFEIEEVVEAELQGEPDFGVETEVVAEYVEQFNGVNFVARQNGETVLVGNFSVKVV